MKGHLKSFMGQYKEMSHTMDESNKEREEVRLYRGSPMSDKYLSC